MLRKPALFRVTFWRVAKQILCEFNSIIHSLSVLMSVSKSILKSLSTHVKEHFTNASYGAYPIENDSQIAILIVANKYSPNNFWYVI